MNKLVFCLVIVSLCLTCIFAQSKGKKQSVTATPKVGIRSVDFRNFTYDNVDADGKSVKLRNGRNLIKGESSPNSPFYGSKINTIRYMDFDGDKKEEAFVVLDYTLEQAGAYWVQHYFIFAYRDGKAQEIFHESSYKALGFRLKGKSLITAAPFWKDDDGHCCPSQTEIATYSWRGNGFRASKKFKQGCCSVSEVQW